MTKPVRYQEGHLYVHHEAWFVRYREPVRRPDGSIKDRQKAKKLGSVRDYPRESQIKPLVAGFMRRLNAGRFAPEACMTLTEFVENFYFEVHRGKARVHEKELYGNLEQPHPRSYRSHSSA